jgi:hypothetical protein
MRVGGWDCQIKQPLPGAMSEGFLTDGVASAGGPAADYWWEIVAATDLASIPSSFREK